MKNWSWLSVHERLLSNNHKCGQPFLESELTQCIACEGFLGLILAIFYHFWRHPYRLILFYWWSVAPSGATIEWSFWGLLSWRLLPAIAIFYHAIALQVYLWEIHPLDHQRRARLMREIWILEITYFLWCLILSSSPPN